MNRLRHFKDVSWLLFVCIGVGGALMLWFNLRPIPFSGATAGEVAQRAREATREEVEYAILAVGDPDTTQEQINARWQEVAQENAVPDVVVERARLSCAARTWPVEVRPGSVNETQVWVAVCGWPFDPGPSGCIDWGCDDLIAAQKERARRFTEVVVISDEAKPQTLAHAGREPLTQTRRLQAN